MRKRLSKGKEETQGTRTEERKEEGRVAGHLAKKSAENERRRKKEPPRERRISYSRECRKRKARQ